MARIAITIRARSSLSLGTIKGYGGTLIETGLYVRGGILRGALGRIKPCVSSSEQDEIDALLGTADQAAIQFPNCYLTDRYQAYPVPFTARTCKQMSGFIGEETTNKHNHGVADTLLMQLAYDRIARAGDDWQIPLPFQYRCPTCGHRTEALEGVIECRGQRTYSQPKASWHRQTRVAINRARLTAEEGQLYSVQAIDEGSTFAGVMDVDDAHAELARSWLIRINRIGGRISRGFGRVTIEVGDPPPEERIGDRIASFNNQYRAFETELRSIAHEPPAADTRTLFTINLRSDALLRTREGLPTLCFDETMLIEALKDLLEVENGEPGHAILDSQLITPIARYTHPQQISGWQTAWQLPKEVLLGSRMGGLYVFAADIGNDESKREALNDLLGRLEAAGIGEFREDGYGQITVCDPFHLEVNPV